jgi:hypothetical protein
MAWFLGAYAARGGTNLGIWLCRPIAGSTERSVHSEGRACDLGTPGVTTWSLAVADALVASSAELGIQCVIHNRRIWSSSYWDKGWRPYTGSDPHTGHLHVELDRAAARILTVALINGALSPAPPPTKPTKGTDVPDLLIADTHGNPGKIYARYRDGRTVHLGPTEYAYWAGKGVPGITLTDKESDVRERLEAARVDK